jgi:hypothetical protein
MSSTSQGSSRPLPEHPDLRHLKDQAKDLKKAGRAVSLASAQLQVARQYGFASWPKLKAHVESLQTVGQLKQAIDANDLERVKQMMTRNPELHRAPLGYGKNGPLTWVAECRVPREAPSEATRLWRFYLVFEEFLPPIPRRRRGRRTSGAPSDQTHPCPRRLWSCSPRSLSRSAVGTG